MKRGSIFGPGTAAVGGAMAGVAVLIAAAIGFTFLNVTEDPAAGDPAVIVPATPSLIQGEVGSDRSDAADFPGDVPSNVAGDVAGDAGTQAPSGDQQAASAPDAPDDPDLAELVPPRLDLVRVGDDGTTIIAGHASPGADVSILIDGESVYMARAETSGDFGAVVFLEPSDRPRLLGVEARGADGRIEAGSETVIITPFGRPVAGFASPAQSPVGTVEGAQADTISGTRTGTVTAPVGLDVPAPLATGTGIAVTVPARQTGPGALPGTGASASPDTVTGLARPAPPNTLPSPIAPVGSPSGADGAADYAGVAGDEPPREAASAVVSDPTGIASSDATDPIAETAVAAETAVPAQTILPSEPSVPGEAEAQDADPTEPPGATAQAARDDPPEPPALDPAAEARSDTRTIATQEAARPPVQSSAPDPEAPPGALATEPARPVPPVALSNTLSPALSDPGPAPPQSPTSPRASAGPTVIIAGPDGIRVNRDSAPEPEALTSIRLDAISYTPQGDVMLAGRGPAERDIRVSLDTQPIQLGEIGPGGDWSVQLPDVDAGTYTLIVAELSEDGRVMSQVETPFLREDPARIAAGPAQAQRAGVDVITVQPGFTLWGIAQRNFGDGILYVQIFEENSDQIRDPDWIFPGQIFRLPDLPRPPAED